MDRRLFVMSSGLDRESSGRGGDRTSCLSPEPLALRACRRTLSFGVRGGRRARRWEMVGDRGLALSPGVRLSRKSLRTLDLRNYNSSSTLASVSPVWFCSGLI